MVLGAFWRNLLRGVSGMADSPKVIDFGFVGRDVRNQIAHGRTLLEVIQNLQKTAETVKEPEARQQIDDTIKTLLSVVNSMAANVRTTTSGTSTSIVGTIFPTKRE